MITSHGTFTLPGDSDGITWADYQRRAHNTAVYPPEHALMYLALGLAGEAGEFANRAKKVLRDGTADSMAHAEAELGDVLWYVAELCTLLEVDLEAVARANLDKLADRAARGVLGGGGDTR